jgi:hypothetical protein
MIAVLKNTNSHELLYIVQQHEVPFLFPCFLLLVLTYLQIYNCERRTVMVAQEEDVLGGGGLVSAGSCNKFLG